MNLFTRGTFNTGEFKAFHNIHIVVLPQSQLCIRKSRHYKPKKSHFQHDEITWKNFHGEAHLDFPNVTGLNGLLSGSAASHCLGLGGFHAQKTFFTISPQFISKMKADASPQTSLCTYKIMNTDKANAIWKHPIIS